MTLYNFQQILNCCEIIGPNQGGAGDQWYTWECLEKFLFLRYYEDTASTWLVKHFNKLYHYSMIELKGLDVLVPRVVHSPFWLKWKNQTFKNNLNKTLL